MVWGGGGYATTTSHETQHKKPVLISDEKIKWLDFGCISEGSNPDHILGSVWVKCGYGDSIPWQHVRLSKQRNIDLTTYGLGDAFENATGCCSEL